MPGSAACVFSRGPPGWPLNKLIQVRSGLMLCRMVFRLVFLLGFAAGMTSIAYAQSGALLPTGYLSVSGNQIMSGGTPVRLACVGYSNPGSAGSYNADMLAVRAAGWNCVRISYYDATLCPGGTCDFTTFDAYISAATANRVKVIIDHHGNEGINGDGCLGQQLNGLWYDLNGTAPYNTTDNQNGCGSTGTITYAQFKANWVSIATHYAGNSTVVGFDLDNEPLAYGVNVVTQANWGGVGGNGQSFSSGNGSDILAMYNDVGAALESADPGALIICEGLINDNEGYAKLLNGATFPLTAGAIADLTLAHSNPVTAASSHVVYSIHDYPNSISGVEPDSGTGSVTARNTAWGFLVTNNYAPVWIGEMGASLDNTNGYQTEEESWATTLVSYLNGGQSANGGPAFTGTQQPIGSDWWDYGYVPGQIPDGACAVANCSSFKTVQQTYFSQVLYTPSTVTWNASDKSSNVTLSSGNLTSTLTSSTAGGVRDNLSRATGKYCFESTMSTATSDWNIGIANASFVLNTPGQLGTDANGVGFYPVSPTQAIYYNGVQLTSGSTADVSGDKITVCADLTNHLIWVSTPVMRAAGQTWNNSASANPSTGAGGSSFSGLTGPYFIAHTDDISGGVATLNATGPFAVSTPSGFDPWQ